MFEKTHITQFGNDHPLSHPEGGKSDTTEILSYEDCVLYFNNYYKNLRKSFVIYGDIDEERIRAFDFDKTFKISKKPCLTPLPKLAKKELVIEAQNSTAEIVHSSVIERSNLYTSTFIDFVDYVIGQSPYSLLYELLRGNGIAYDTRSKLYRYSDCSLFTLYFGISNKNYSNTTIESIYGLLDRIEEVVPKNRFELYKQAYSKRISMTFDNPMIIVNKVLESMVFDGNPKNLDTILEEVSKISYIDFIDFIKKYFTKDNLSVTMIR